MDSPVRATPEQAAAVARLLHDFNTEFTTPSPGVGLLTARLRRLLATDMTVAFVVGDPGVAVALVSYRTNVWFDGPVALLDELYVAPPLRDRGIGSALLEAVLAEAVGRGAGMVEINVDEGDVDAQRFYVRHGFRTSDPGSTERALYVWREL